MTAANKPDLIATLNETCAAELRRRGASKQLSELHGCVSELEISIRHAHMRSSIRSEVSSLIISAWSLALNFCDSPDDLTAAIGRELTRLQSILADGKNQ